MGKQLLERLSQGRSPGCSVTGWLSLQLGVLFLPTSALFAGLSFLVAITVARPQGGPRPLQRPIAKALLVLALLMLLALTTALKPGLAALGLANWLPFFWFFLAVDPYLQRPESRRRLGLWLLVGSMPVIVVGLLQVWLGWSTPIQGLGGLVQWTMRYPGRATGIFDTINGTAGWLLLCIPFLLHRLRCHPNHPLLLGVTLTATALTTAALLLTSSRSSVLLLPLVLLLSSRRRQLPWVLAILGLYALLVGIKLTGAADQWPAIKLLVPDLLTSKLERLIDPAGASMQSPEVRTSLYPLGLQLLRGSPWLGIGENGFRTVYLSGALPLPAGEGLNHTHSLPLEFAISHGLPALMLLLAIIGHVCMSALRQWRRHSDPQGQDRAWLIAAGIIIWLHLWDIPAYDSRFNMLDWLVFAALLGISSGAVRSEGTAQPGPTGQPGQMESPLNGQA